MEMDDAKSREIEKTHRKFAADLFNRVWDLMEAENRSEAEVQEMIHTAHASRYHWGEIGGPTQFARGEWQISRVYSILGYGEAALRHAEYCLMWCERESIGAFDLAFAHEALARAYNILQQEDKKDMHLRIAEKIGDEIDDEENRVWLKDNLETI
jgi:hypothetical protein